MVKKELIDALRSFTFSVFGRDHISKVFPDLLANVCRSMTVINMYGSSQPIIHDWGKLVEFKINLSTAIYTDSYDQLDNIIIDFFNTYNYKIMDPKGRFLMFEVDFTKEAEESFSAICNTFKEKKWDDIINQFLDALYIFLSSATIHGDSLIEWH